EQPAAWRPGSSWLHLRSPRGGGQLRDAPPQLFRPPLVALQVRVVVWLRRLGRRRARATRPSCTNSRTSHPYSSSRAQHRREWPELFPGVDQSQRDAKRVVPPTLALRAERVGPQSGNWRPEWLGGQGSRPSQSVPRRAERSLASRHSDRSIQEPEGAA